VSKKLPNLPKYTLRFGGIEVKLGQFFENRRTGGSLETPVGEGALYRARVFLPNEPN
jgi:hypothetical protein